MKGEGWGLWVQRLRERKAVAAVHIGLRLLVLLVMIAQAFNHNYQNVFLCLLVLVLFCLPDFFKRQLVLKLPDALEIVLLLFIFAAEILGEIGEYYVQFPHWDTMLHTLNGFLAAAIGFSLIDILNRREKDSLRVSPFYLSVVAFCFSMTIGAVWELFEFGMDWFAGFDMQKDAVLGQIATVMLDPAQGQKVVTCGPIRDTILVYEDGRQQALGLGGYLDIGLVDTMQDLFVNFLGALCFSILGFFFVKNRGKGRLVRNLLPRSLSSGEVERIIRQEKSATGKSRLEQKLNRYKARKNRPE